ncbi:hypothetical protein V6N11_008463 [Hibiscus sabdariffa]|uniref:Uncharacterized protein n=2 Tax=Hibiscus sabdariffa TaxID=183260 RepID=A0ABR2DA88_9ROSI
MVEEATTSLRKVTVAGHTYGVLKPMRQASKVQKVVSYGKLDREVIKNAESTSKMYFSQLDPKVDTREGPYENVMDTQSGLEAIKGEKLTILKQIGLTVWISSLTQVRA